MIQRIVLCLLLMSCASTPKVDPKELWLAKGQYETCLYAYWDLLGVHELADKCHPEYVRFMELTTASMSSAQLRNYEKTAEKRELESARAWLDSLHKTSTPIEASEQAVE